MSDHELPPELSDWPTNPFLLLGVQPSVEPRDLKRAYTQLIRVYKPEQFPDHFRRLREAYETVLRHVEFRAKYQSQNDEPDTASPIVTPVQVRPLEDVVSEPQTISWSAQLDQIWETAASGLEEPAYRQFVELEQLHPGHPDLCVRLYWLLALEPRLDAAREAEDWLAKGLMNVGLSGPLYELYRRRISHYPQEALGERCEKLLSAPATPGMLAAFAEQRWSAAAMLGDAAPVVVRDLQRLRPAIEAQAEEIWINLTVRGMEHLAWSGDSGLREKAAEYRRQVEAAEHLHRRLEYLLDRMEMMFETASIWRECQHRINHGDVLYRIVRLSRLTDFTTARPQLESELRTALITPTAMLNGLSSVLTRSSVAALAFGELLDQWESACEPPHDFREPERVQKQILTFVRRTEFWNYSACREKLLNFCLEEVVPTEQLVYAMQDVELYGPLAELIAKDVALRYVTRAHRLFWA